MTAAVCTQRCAVYRPVRASTTPVVSMTNATSMTTSVRSAPTLPLRAEKPRAVEIGDHRGTSREVTTASVDA